MIVNQDELAIILCALLAVYVPIKFMEVRLCLTYKVFVKKILEVALCFL